MAKQLVRNEDETISSDEEHEIEPELADVPFGELQKLKSDGTVAFVSRIKSEKKTTGRGNKNRLMEVSSKKPIGRFRDVFQVPKKTIRDPRVEPLRGKLDDDGFKKRFNFLFDKNLPAEKEDLQKKLKSSKNPKVSEELKDRIAWIDKQLKFDVSKSAEDRILAEHKKREREAAKQDKRPFYLKKFCGGAEYTSAKRDRSFVGSSSGASTMDGGIHPQQSPIPDQMKMRNKDYVDEVLVKHFIVNNIVFNIV